MDGRLVGLLVEWMDGWSVGWLVGKSGKLVEWIDGLLGLWALVQEEFGDVYGHTCDLMVLDSNAMIDVKGYPLPTLLRTHPQDPGM